MRGYAIKNITLKSTKANPYEYSVLDHTGNASLTIVYDCDGTNTLTTDMYDYIASLTERPTGISVSGINGVDNDMEVTITFEPIQSYEM